MLLFHFRSSGFLCQVADSDMCIAQVGKPQLGLEARGLGNLSVQLQLFDYASRVEGAPR